MIGRNVFSWIKTKILKSGSLSIRDNNNSEYMKVYKKDDNTAFIYGKIPELCIGNGIDTGSYYLSITTGGVCWMKAHVWAYGDDIYPIGSSIHRFNSGHFGTGGIFSDNKVTISSDTLLNVPMTATVPTSPAVGDVYLDNGLNTGDGKPHFRYWSGTSWVDL